MFEVGYLKVNVRVMALVLLTLLSSWYLFSPLIFKKSGVVVMSVDEGSECGNIVSGDFINYIGGQKIKNVDDFEGAIRNIEEGIRVTMVVNRGPGGCTAIEDGDIGLEVSEAPSEFIKFGLNIYGGKRVWLKINDESLSMGPNLNDNFIEDVKNIIEDRAKIIGVSKIKAGIEEDKLYIDTLNLNDLPLLIEKGELEGHIEQRINFLNGEGQIKIESEYYEMVLLNESSNESILIIEGNEYGSGESFVIDDINFKIMNITENSVVVSGLVFNNTEVKPAEGGSSYMRYDSATRQYQFFVPIELSSSSGNRFSKITDGLPSMYAGAVNILDGMLVFYVDGEEINRLTIPTSMAGQTVKSISIIGFGSSSKESLNKKKVVEAAIVGNIDYDISIDETTEHEGGLLWLLYTGLGIVFIISLISFTLPVFFYKLRGGTKVGLLLSSLFLSTIFNIFGIATITQSLFTPGWIFDSASVFGILIVGLLLLLSFISTSEKILKRKRLKSKAYLDFAVLIFGFALLFTKFSGFGLCLIVGFALNWLIITPIYKKSLSSY